MTPPSAPQAPAAPLATVTGRGLLTLSAAKRAWEVANKIERIHADHCLKLATGRRCGTCRDLEAAQNIAADAVTRARRGIYR